jgi:hypothetical protein
LKEKRHPYRYTAISLDSLQTRHKDIFTSCLIVLCIALFQSIRNKENGKNRRFIKSGCFVFPCHGLSRQTVFQQQTVVCNFVADKRTGKEA